MITNTTEERTRLVIIGAGIAGLGAAKTLEDENFDDYILLEGKKKNNFSKQFVSF